MKEPSKAPFYGGIYPGLCDIARAHGYALAIHGSMERDLDLIAVPWTDEATDAESMVAAMKDRLGALDYGDLLQVGGGLTPEQAADIVARANKPNPEEKPHGRRAWLLYLHHGCSVDLSVTPK